MELSATRIVWLYALVCVAYVFGGCRGGVADPEWSREQVLLPDGKPFEFWRPSLDRFNKTYYVNCRNPSASDSNPGTKERPFKTINRAAQVLEPGQRVVVAGGIYREVISPLRGGSGPNAMISYQAAPGEQVIVRGSRVFAEQWSKPRDEKPPTNVWVAPLNDSYFGQYKPFSTPNITPEDFKYMPWAARFVKAKPYVLPRGLVFQDGKRLTQVDSYADLALREGAYSVSPDGKLLYVHPLGNINPGKAQFEITTQESVFAPREPELGYVHVKGFIFEHAGNGFPLPQVGAVSTGRGNHWVIEDNVIRQANSVGLDIGVQARRWPVKTKVGFHIVRRNTITDCGVCGLAGLEPTGSLIEGNLLVRNAFHPVEGYCETAGIKTHTNVNVLIRRNVIIDTLHGAGIWMDWDNKNSRCTQNVLVGNRTQFGAIFIEASETPNVVDRNVIWNTVGEGICERDSTGQRFAYNFIAYSGKTGIALHGKVTNRSLNGKPIADGRNTVYGNILIGNESPVLARGPDNVLRENLTQGIEVKLDLPKLRLTWLCLKPAQFLRDPPPTEEAASPIAKLIRPVWPGPFGKPPTTASTVQLAPPDLADKAAAVLAEAQGAAGQ